MRLPIAAGLSTLAVATTLYQLFDGGQWLLSTIGAVIVIVAVGVGASSLALPVWLATAAQVAGLWIYLTTTFTGDEAWARVFPTIDSVAALAKLISTGYSDIQRFAPPVPANESIVLFTTVGIGLITILVDLLAVRLRRAALAGLPLLALFVVPAEIITDQLPWPAFILAALGFTGLLLADGRERIGHWGRAVLVRRTRGAVRPAGPGGPLRLSGKRIGVTAIALAVLVPALLPTLDPNPLFTFGIGSGDGKGEGNTISIPNPIVGLKGQLTLPENATVLTYVNNDDVPRYLRMWSLDTFDGDVWTMSNPSGSPDNRVDRGTLPEPPGQGPTVPVTESWTDIRISEEIDDELQFLPLPYPAVRVTAEGDWRADKSTLMVFSTRDYASGLSYRVVSRQPRPSPETLKAAPAPDPEVADRYLRLPESLPPEVRRQAEMVTDGKRSDYEKAVRLQEWFTGDGDFTYNLSTQSGHSNSALLDFITVSRVGYCEQFAAAMAVMARTLGIPARVATGYTGGTSLGGGRWQVGTHDMHAWPELYFEGVGWLAFEPTPSGSGGQGTARVPDYTRPPADEPGPTTSSPGPTGSETDPAGTPSGGPNTPRNPALIDREGTIGPLPAEEQSTPLAVRLGLGALVLALIVLIPAALRVVLRRRRLRVVARPATEAASGDGGGGPGGAPAEVRTGRRQVSPVAAAWAEFDDALLDYGLSREPSETPRALTRRLVREYGFDALSTAAIERISGAAERMMFARDPGEQRPLGEDLHRVRRALAAKVSRGRRIRAVLLPPSTLRRLRALGGRVMDGFDRLENLRVRRTS
ncbi:DUF3488 and transglutaminase-like domain-containing protein [Spongiactinospora sp. TRM90649]|uniref:transglutaminase TgpA family protein n=1 Tax=Spongiactinospora sp. TRM90649 TaxID=3031114 RepID=UPI0023F9D98B|nr:DUF3488 and transglutaminase-like domain-containing protein [Spongiactinospora sp. TRM90649]MDF5756851.1 DUF3488 and transglutaminase-like domain-containing protein [Spongiactinospora sp. TRM90649]